MRFPSSLNQRGWNAAKKTLFPLCVWLGATYNYHRRHASPEWGNCDFRQTFRDGIAFLIKWNETRTGLGREDRSLQWRRWQGEWVVPAETPLRVLGLVTFTPKNHHSFIHSFRQHVLSPSCVLGSVDIEQIRQKFPSWLQAHSHGDDF